MEPLKIIYLWKKCYYALIGVVIISLNVTFIGDANNLHGFEIDKNLYLLMKKVAMWCKFDHSYCHIS